MTILELECWRASSNQVVKWLKVSLLLKQAQNLVHSDKPENIRDEAAVLSILYKDIIHWHLIRFPWYTADYLLQYLQHINLCAELDPAFPIPTVEIQI